MSAEEIVWEDPPCGVDNRRGRWFRFVDELRRNPGRWAVAQTFPSKTKASYLASILRGRECEVAVVGELDGSATIYARWPAAAGSGAPK